LSIPEFIVQVGDAFSSVTIDEPEPSGWIALILALVMFIGSGFASASEIAFFSLSPQDLNEIEDEGHASDKIIKRLLKDSEHLLATILVTNNFVNVLIILLVNFFFGQCLSFGHNELAQFLVLTVALTFLLLLFGEIMPKIFSAQNTLRFCRIAAPGVAVCERIFSPVSRLLTSSTEHIQKRFQKKKKIISVDDLSQALELTDKAEITQENEILEGIIRFGGERVRDVMTGRMDMVALDIKSSFHTVLKCITEHSYSRIPVYAGSNDNIKGILYIKDLLSHIQKGDTFRWQSLMRQPLFVPETKMIDTLLRDFQANKVHIAIVVDEFGGTCGLVTMEDIIEEIVGEISDEYDEEENHFAQLEENTWIFKAKTSLSDFYRITNLDEEVFEDISSEVDTVAGLLLEIKGEFPKVHETIEYKSIYIFKVLEMDDRRIKKVKFEIKNN